MGLDVIRGALKKLHQNAQDEAAWGHLEAELATPVASEEASQQLLTARVSHRERGEWEAVARLMALECSLTSGDDSVSILMELSRVRQEELLDEEAALLAFRAVLELTPEDELAEVGVAEIESNQAAWRQRLSEYLKQAEEAPDDEYKSSMLMHAAQTQWRFAGKDRDLDAILGTLAQAAEANPRNTRVLHMLERIYWSKGDHSALAEVLERWVRLGSEGSARVAAAARLARLQRNHLNDIDASISAEETVLEVAQSVVETAPTPRGSLPTPNPVVHQAVVEATEFLTERYSSLEDWDRLAALQARVVDQLAVGRRRDVSDLLQVAMLHFKKRKNLADAAVWFERVRKLEPANAATLEFFREYSSGIGDEGLLLKVLQEAQRVLPKGGDKVSLTEEIAKLAENQNDAQNAIEQYKTLLRQEPGNSDARSALKSLYRKTQGYNQLVDLLRTELDLLGPDQSEERTSLLREVAGVYREHIPNETALVSALNQLLQQDESNVEAVRELIALYGKLGRGRDLLLCQQRLAQLTTDDDEKIELLRSSGRRWLKDFSNVQNATQAFEELLELRPNDREARDTLSELYKKRRAWPALFALYGSELENLEGAKRIAVMKEMAELASVRLNKPKESIRLYQQTLELEPSNVAALDALEKQAERSRDYETLAQALEQRADNAQDTSLKVAALQKLGVVYGDHLKNADKATAAWTRVLELEPGHSRAVRVLRDHYLAIRDDKGLESLYLSQSDAEGLAEVFSNAADREADIRRKIELSYRAAAVYEESLNSGQRALRSYERILSADPMDTRAARALVPLYENEEKWARLPALYELRLTDSADQTEKLELYEKLADVSGRQLGDKSAAVQYAKHAYASFPEEPRALELFEGACATASAWEEFATTLEQRVETLSAPVEQKKKKQKKHKQQAAPDFDQIRGLRLRLARVYHAELDKTDAAIACYKELLKANPSDVSTGQLLEELLRAKGKRNDLRWLLDERVKHAADTSEKVELLREWALLEEDVFEDLPAAIALHQRTLELLPNQPLALSHLSRLHLASGDADAAVAVMKQRIAAADADAPEISAELAEVLLLRLSRPPQALEYALKALELDKGNDRAVDVLERLVASDSTRARAAAALADHYSETAQQRKEADILAVIIGLEKDAGKRRDLMLRASEVNEGLGSYGSAFESTLQACREFPKDIEQWVRASALAEQTGRPTELAEAYRDVLSQDLVAKDTETVKLLAERAASLHEIDLGDPAGAAPYLERVLELEPTDDEAYSKLKQIFTSSQSWGKLQALYDRTLPVTEDPQARLEILNDVATVCESLMDKPELAVGYFEQMLELEPTNDIAFPALDRLYTKNGEHAKLETLLESRAGHDSFTTELRLRLAKLQLESLHHPKKALAHVESVLSEDVTSAEGRVLAERILDIGSLRPRAAALLAKVHESRDEVRDLVRVLEIQLELVDSSQEPPKDLDALKLLQRLAELKNRRLRDDEGAGAAYLRYIALAPEDAQARAELIEISARLGTHEKTAIALRQAAKSTDSVRLKGELLNQSASLLSESLGDDEGAEALYKQVLGLDPEDGALVVPAAHALELIHERREAHPELASVLRTQLKFEEDFERKANLNARVAELCESRLGDSDGAIQCWQAVLEDVPDDPRALVALDRLYEKTGSYEKLVVVQKQRLDLEGEDAGRRELSSRLAETYAKHLDRPEEAIEAYRGLLEESGEDSATLSRLSVLFEKTERWEDLVDNEQARLDLLETHEGNTETDAERVDLISKIGALRETRLGDPSSALEQYRQAVTLDPDNKLARAALARLRDNPDTFVRREACEILIPLFETSGDSQELLESLEVQAKITDDAVERLDVLKRAAEVADNGLKQPDKALGYVKEALKSAVGHVDVDPWLEELERLSALTGQRKGQVDLLSSIAPAILDGETQYAVLLRIGELAKTKLQDNELALTHYRKALELRSDSLEALTALEELYDAEADHDSMLDVLERRAELAQSDEDRKALLLRRAELLLVQLRDPGRAAQVLQSILDFDFDRGAVDSLVSIYTEEQSWSDLIDLHSRRIDHEPNNEPELRVAMADVLTSQLSDPGRALDQLSAALDSDVTYVPAIERLEKIMAADGSPESRSRAASVLEPIYLARSDFDQLIGVLRARLEWSDDAVQRRDLLERLAQLYEEQKEDYSAALEITAQLFHDDIADDACVAEMERLARVADNRERLAEIYADELSKIDVDDAVGGRLARRAGELYRDLAQNDKALVFLRRAMDYEPESVDLFEVVDNILVEGKRHTERLALYRGSLEHRYDDDTRVSMLHTIAEIEHRELGNKQEAITAYCELLDVRGDDARALDAVSALYYETGRYEDLYDLILRLVEGSDEVSQEVAYRMGLARLCKNDIKDPKRALAQLEEVVVLEPQHQEALNELDALRSVPELKEQVVNVLLPLYEARDDWRRLIKLNEDRYQLAQDDIDKIRVLRDTADLWETRGSDPARALQGIGAAVRLDPEDDELRANFERLTKETGAWEGLSQTYSDLLEKKPDLACARDLWATLARVHDGPRDDPRAALDAYRKLHELDAFDRAPVERMDSLATLLSDWAVLDEVLVAKAELVDTDEERASVWRRIGEGRRDMLDEANGAREAYERALEFEPESAFTIDCLISLQEDGGKPERLVELYQQRVELTDSDDGEFRYQLLVAAADTYRLQLREPEQAIYQLTQALEERPNDPAVLAHLEQLYQQEERWQELLDNLEQQADNTSDAQQKIELGRRIGSLLESKLDNYDGALEAYRQVLEDSPGDEQARDAVLGIGERYEELRETVADILVPPLTQAGDYPCLAKALEFRLSVEGEGETRAGTLRKLAEIQSKQLGQPDVALKTLLRAVNEIPEDDSLHQAVYSSCSTTDQWRAYADALQKRTQSTFDPELCKSLLCRVAVIAEANLKDEPRAIQAYIQAIEQVGDTPDLLQPLYVLYKGEKNWQKFADVVERFTVIAETDDDRARLHRELGQVQIAEFNEPGHGLESLRASLELEPDNEDTVLALEGLLEHNELFEEAGAILEDVYRSRHATGKLAALLRRRVDLAISPEERQDLRRNLARVLEEELGDATQAQQIVQQNLLEDPRDSDALREMERLASVTGDWSQAAETLEKVVASDDLDPEDGMSLCLQLSEWCAERLDDQTRAETALQRALVFSPTSEETLERLDRAQTLPGREAARIETLRRRAKLQYDLSEREQTTRVALSLAQQIGDGDIVESVLHEYLQEDPTNAWALEQLSLTYEQAKKHQEFLGVLERQIDATLDGAEVARLRHRAAAVALTELQDPKRAIELYESIFEDDSRDSVASSALRKLYDSEQRPDALARLLERRIDLSDDVASRSELRLELAALSRESFNSVDGAIETLRELLADEPGHSEAVVQLSRLFEGAGRDEELAELLNEQIAAAKSRGDHQAELRFEVRLGETYESKLGDKNRAVQTYDRVLEQDPNHVEALRALGRLHESAQDYAEAAKCLKTLVELIPGAEQIDVSRRLSQCLLKAGDRDGAIGALERVTQLDATDAAARHQLGQLYRDGAMWTQLGELIATEASGVAEAKKKVQLLGDAARIFGEQAKDPARAAQLLEEALALNDGDRTLLMLLCDAYNDSGRANDAVKVLERVVDSYGGRRSKDLADIHRRLAVAYRSTDNLERAAEELNKAYRIEPGNVAVLTALGKLSLEVNDLKQAQNVFVALLLQKLKPDSGITKAEVQYNLGVVYHRMGEKSKAVQNLERSLRNDPDLEDARVLLYQLREGQ